MKNFKLGDTPIAVVGMASLMPDAKDLSSYWDNIAERLVSIVDVPEDRWSIDDYYDSNPMTPDKTYCKRGAFIPDIEFNPVEYGLPPNILEVTDVSQLLGLVVAKDVLADTGINSEEDYDHDRIGITLGIGGGQKLSAALTARLQYPVIDKVLAGAGVPEAERNIIIEKYKKAFVPWEENSFPGLLGNVIAGRIANRFNFGGMNSVVDAACASALSAMKMAVNELVLGNSDLMITGGSCTDNSIFMYMSFSKTPAFTPADFIKPFDAESNGMMVGEGIGMIALKRLEDAERDGDRIYAVIKGVGSSSDGRFKSIYAPRSEGQAKALNRAYEQAGFEPKTVGLVEAHGTGTAAGDVAEFNSLKMVFSQNNDEKQHIALGSVKSQIGHLKAAAGAAGFMKCALALHHKVLPPTASVKTPNPKLGVEDSPFYINAETRPWLPAKDGSPRRAAVSAFGFGGTNFHFVLEEYQKEMSGQTRLKHVDQVHLIHGKDSSALLQACEQYLSDLSQGESPALYQSFIDQTVLTEVPAENARLAFVSNEAAVAKSQLELAIKTLKEKSSDASWELPQGISFAAKAENPSGKVVALFPGQGSQYVRMGDALAQNFPEFRDGLVQLDALFIKDGKERLSDIIYPIAAFNTEDKKTQEAKLQLTQHAQPSIGAFSVGAYKLFQKAGFKADFVAGHSFGELTALWAAGVYSDEDFFFLAKSRGAAMAAPDDKDFDAGSMMAISGDISTLEDVLKKHPEIKIANFNSNAQVVIAGAKQALANAQEDLKSAGLKTIQLPVSAAFHTPLVAHAQKPFAQAIEKVKFKKPSIAVYSNGSGKAHENSAEKIKAALKDHILNSVQFRDEIESIYKDGGRIFVEFGPKNVLSKLCDNILEGKEDVKTYSVNPAAGKNADSQLKLLAAKLAVAGVNLSNIDPYVSPRLEHTTQKTSPLNIKISAAAYVSEKTRNAFIDGLNDGFTLQTTKEIPVPAPSSSTPLSTISPSPNINAEINLDQFYALQNETLRVHEKYLENPAQYVESFQGLLSQITELMKDNPDFVLPESIERSLQAFNEQQQSTIKVHENFLNQQSQASQASLKLMNEHYSLLTGASISLPTQKNEVGTSQATAQVAEEQSTTTVDSETLPPVHIASAIPQDNALDIRALTSEMLAVVAEKTGYPSEMLELDMDMEADLGIDSIKRVEILGSIQEAHPELPELDPEALSELRTLQQIVDYIKDQAPTGVAVSAATTVSSNAAPVSGIDIQSLTKEMLTVVAEKTGYPEEMLELEMDMEADLGIDSIKRVEILGSIQEAHPELPELDPEALSELRTLQQIVDYIKDQAPTGVAVSAATTVSSNAAPVSGIDIQSLTKEMLTVVAEKTGYPEEMLELEMDMEADLGIDSIKRVEILGSIQEAHPELPELDPEALSELRTLQQIVDYIQAQAPSASLSTVVQNDAPAVSASTSVNIEEVKQSMLQVVADKTGYPIEMLEMDMDMEADLGIDSIKRVEILGTVQELFPDLPELNPEELAELRTLAEIVSYIENAAPAATNSNTDAVNPSAQATQTALNIEGLTSEMLKVVADKTGYPEEMLELNMDMEADLGIDSIKRVEILGTIQENNPGLPELDPEALSELRTLSEIVNYMQEQATALTGLSEIAVETNVVSLPAHKEGKGQASSADQVLKPARASVSVRVLAKPDHLLSTVPEDRSCIIVNDGTELTAEVVKAYQDLSWKVTLLSFPESSLHQSAQDIPRCRYEQLESFEESELKTVLQRIESETGATANFIYLDSVYKSTAKQALNLDSKRSLVLRHVFLIAKHIKESLNQIDAGTRNAFICVAHMDGALGYAEKTNPYDASTAALFGLCKTLHQEWPDVFCRAIDAHASLSKKVLTQKLIEENNDADSSLVEVGITKDMRMTLEAKEIFSRPELGDSNQHHITKDSVFLVSGGAKGVTASCVLELAKAYQCKFILLGRSQLNDGEPDWAQAAHDDNALKQAAMAHLKEQGEKPTPVKVEKLMAPVLSQREIKTGLGNLTSVGAQVRYLACDVCNQKELKKSLKSIQSELGEITGIVHGAGVLADKFIEQKTPEDFDAVFNTKISGLASLFNAVPVKNLQHLVLFSSAAGFFGNPGQSDYAMANDVLNKVALQVKSQFPDCRVLSFNWGPWDGGMVTPQLKKLFEARGVELISIAGGAQLFLDYLSAAHGELAQVLVGSSMESDASEQLTQKKSLKFPDNVTLHRELDLVENPFLQDHMLGNEAVLPMVCSAAWHAQSALNLAPGYLLKSIKNLQVFKGLTFSSENAKLLCHQELNKFTLNTEGELEVKSIIYSNNEGKRLNHYGAEVVLSRSRQQTGTESIGEDQFDIVSRSENASVFYKDGTLFHGKGLQLLTHYLKESNQRYWFTAKAADYSSKQQGQFPETSHQQFAMDALLQACLVWAKEEKNLPSLPLSIARLDVFDAIGSGSDLLVRLDVTEQSDSKMCCDLSCFSKQGKLLAKMEGAQVTMSKQLEQKFAS